MILLLMIVCTESSSISKSFRATWSTYGDHESTCPSGRITGGCASKVSRGSRADHACGIQVCGICLSRLFSRLWYTTYGHYSGDLGIRSVRVALKISRDAYAQLTTAPILKPLDWTRSRVRREHLISMGVPVNLDEVCIDFSLSIPHSHTNHTYHSQWDIKLIYRSIHIEYQLSPHSGSQQQKAAVQLP